MGAGDKKTNCTIPKRIGIKQEIPKRKTSDRDKTMKYLGVTASIILPLLAVGLGVCQIVFTNELAGVGSSLQSYDTKIETLGAENATMDQKVASLSSLLVIEERAKAMGFTETKKYLTIGESQFPVALNTAR